MDILDNGYKRVDNRAFDQMRNIKITRNYTKYSQGSVLIEFGDTKVICTASVEDGVPPFLKGSGEGWISAEYSMLPSATEKRKKRDSSRGKIDGRSHEIQRLIGRSIRSVVDTSKLGERTIWLDCDVIQADGGTRTASITGAFVAVCDALYSLVESKEIKRMPLNTLLSAVSVGLVDSNPMLDLCYVEDSSAECDMNVVMNHRGEFVEIQGTGESRPFKRAELDRLIDLAVIGNREIMRAQREALGEISDMIIGMEYEKEAVIATGNAHKLEEIGKILSDLDINILSLKDVELDGIEIVEDGKTFEHNALIKARTISRLTGKISIADDSGIEVDYLDKRPGIYSARYSGECATDESNRKKLFSELQGVEMKDRTARFVAVIAVVFPDGKEVISRGTVEGKIAMEEKGDYGFGYDCMFIPDGYDITFGEILPDEKNKFSHRARALDEMKKKLKKIYEERSI